MKLFVAIPTTVQAWKKFMTDEVRAYLEERVEVSYLNMDRLPTAQEVAQRAGDADVIMTGWGNSMMDRQLLEQTNIKLIAKTGGSVADYVNQDVIRRELFLDGLHPNAEGHALMAKKLREVLA